MKSKLLLTVAIGIALAAAPTQFTYAQDKSPVHVVSEIQLPNLASAKAYVDNMGTLVKPKGGRIIVSKTETLDGTLATTPDRTVKDQPAAAAMPDGWQINE